MGFCATLTSSLCYIYVHAKGYLSWKSFCSLRVLNESQAFNVFRPAVCSFFSNAVSTGTFLSFHSNGYLTLALKDLLQPLEEAFPNDCILQL